MHLTLEQYLQACKNNAASARPMRIRRIAGALCLAVNASRFASDFLEAWVALGRDSQRLAAWFASEFAVLSEGHLARGSECCRSGNSSNCLEIASCIVTLVKGDKAILMISFCLFPTGVVFHITPREKRSQWFRWATCRIVILTASSAPALLPDQTKLGHPVK